MRQSFQGHFFNRYIPARFNLGQKPPTLQQCVTVREIRFSIRYIRIILCRHAPQRAQIALDVVLQQSD